MKSHQIVQGRNLIIGTTEMETLPLYKLLSTVLHCKSSSCHLSLIILSYEQPGNLHMTLLLVFQMATDVLLELTAYHTRTELIVVDVKWPSGLRRRSAAGRLLGLWPRIPQEAWMSVGCACCVLSGRGLCVELITRPEESYRERCVSECDHIQQ
jgi:hypothetical protein